mmetsp:Transcript_7725/g.20592  ORF Transcript_7725/g.20592 Transcript_7725/m.20592 type:complete len:219 (-) Transcript_7725:1678-2334(-)
MREEGVCRCMACAGCVWETTEERSSCCVRGGGARAVVRCASTSQVASTPSAHVASFSKRAPPPSPPMLTPSEFSLHCRCPCCCCCWLLLRSIPSTESVHGVAGSRSRCCCWRCCGVCRKRCCSLATWLEPGGCAAGVAGAAAPTESVDLFAATSAAVVSARFPRSRSFQSSGERGPSAMPGCCSASFAAAPPRPPSCALSPPAPGRPAPCCLLEGEEL